jgi:hypothetical protein
VPEKVNEIVPNISLCANSQNKVSDADLFANHPFHVRIESISRRVWAPAAGGSQIQTHWYYERARGQYLNAQTYLSKAKKQEFQLQHPRGQVVTKTDLAKVINTFRCLPHIVSRGAQKNFIAFAEFVGSRDEWDRRDQDFNDDWFKESVSKLIVFRATEKAVQDADWYAQGYRANTVTYAIALVVNAIGNSQAQIDYEWIWRQQAVAPALLAAILAAAQQVQRRIIEASAANSVTNVTEWCKREGCWKDLLEAVAVRLPEELSTKDRSEVQDQRRSSRRERALLTEDEAAIEVVSKGGPYWKRLLDWGRSGLVLNPTDIGVLEVAASLPRRMPTGKQSLRILEALKRAQEDGYQA